MKKILYILGGCLLLLAACKKSEIPHYNASKDIYFSVTDGLGVIQDTTNFSFAFTTNTNDTIVRLRVRGLGSMSTQDREYSVSVIDTAQAAAKQGTHFQLPAKLVMPAGQLETILPVTLHKTTDMETKMFSVTLQLVPNQNFDTSLQYAVIDNTLKKKRYVLRHVVTVTNMLNVPKTWMVEYFGPFSKKKLLLMSEMIPMKLEEFNPPDISIFPIGQYRYIASFMKRYLEDNELAGHPITEEDGSPMVLGIWAN